MSIPVVADADTLFPATTRGLLIYLDYQGLIKLHWSLLILDEVSRALVDTGRKKTLEEARANETRMRDALPYAMVAVEDVQAQFQAVAPAVRPVKDTHVAACAHYLIAANAYPGTSPIALVTRNTRDFRKAVLAGLGITMLKPDDFLHGLITTQPDEVAAAFRQFRLDLSS
ncbi:PIN domain-containing protein [Burkholderia sp. WAC0059]|uniref:PIN domain-containing protein n=1 Tax=Burkholderia sp. WAC0059 TaxID=2066022 RepID=UPI000C7EBBA8|nr:PIN domain-containing protein [Burkholderia sp. WAC0059]PLZ00447.1 PIN domain-containing protein [Burkholderia sp. WAC0059]